MRNLFLLWDVFFLKLYNSKSVNHDSKSCFKAPFSNNLKRAHLSTTFWAYLALQMTCLEIHFGWGFMASLIFPGTLDVQNPPNIRLGGVWNQMFTGSNTDPHKVFG